MFVLRIVFALFIYCLFTLSAFAHQGEDAAKSEWEPVSAGPIATWTAPLCGRGKFVVQPFLFYNRTRGTFNAQGHYSSLPGKDKKYQFQEQIFMQYGLNDKVEIDAQIVYQENFIEQGGIKAKANGLGDSYFFTRYCAFDEKEILPHITGAFQAKIPTGKYQKADPDKLGADLMGASSGVGSYDLGYGVILSKRVKPFLFHLDALYNYPQERKVDGLKVKYGNYLNYDFGVEGFFAQHLSWCFELNGFTQKDKREDGQNTPASDISYLTIAPGIGWSNEKIQTLAAYQRVVTGVNTDANDSVVFTFIYTF